MSIAKTCHLEGFFPRTGTEKELFFPPLPLAVPKNVLKRDANGFRVKDAQANNYTLHKPIN